MLGPHAIAVHLDLSPKRDDAGDAVKVRDRAPARRPVVGVDAAFAVWVRGAVRLVEPALAEQERAVGGEALRVHLRLLPAERDEWRGEAGPHRPPHAETPNPPQPGRGPTG